MDVTQNLIKIIQTFQFDAKKPKAGLQSETPTIPFNQIFSLFNILDKSIGTELKPGFIPENISIDRLMGNQQSGMKQNSVDVKQLDSILTAWAAGIQQEHLSKGIITNNSQVNETQVDELNNENTYVPNNLDGIQKSMFEWVNSHYQLFNPDNDHVEIPNVQTADESVSQGNKLDQTDPNKANLHRFLNQPIPNEIFGKLSNGFKEGISADPKERNSGKTVALNTQVDLNENYHISRRISNPVSTSFLRIPENKATTNETANLIDQQMDIPRVGMGPTYLEQIKPISIQEFIPVVTDVLNSFIREANGSTISAEANIFLPVKDVGIIKIDIASQQGKITTQILTNTPKGKEILEGQIPHLKQGLKQNGVNLDKLEIVQTDHILQQPEKMLQAVFMQNPEAVSQNGMVQKQVEHSPDVNIPNQLSEKRSKLVNDTKHDSRLLNQVIPYSFNQYSTFRSLETSPPSGESSPLTTISDQAGESFVNEKTILQADGSNSNSVSEPLHPVLTVSDFVPELSNWIEAHYRAAPVQNGQTIGNYTLIPESLGSLEINLTLNANQIAAQIVTSSPQTKEALDGQLQQLQGVLQQRGLNVEKLGIVYRDSSIQHLNDGKRNVNRPETNGNIQNDVFTEMNQQKIKRPENLVKHQDTLILKPELTQQNGTEQKPEIMHQNGTMQTPEIQQQNLETPMTRSINGSNNLLDRNKSFQFDNQWNEPLFNGSPTFPFIRTNISSETKPDPVEAVNPSITEATDMFNQISRAVVNENESSGAPVNPDLFVSEFVPEVSKWINRNIKITPGIQEVSMGKFSLIPRELGSVEMKITSDNGQIAAQIIIDSLEAKGALEKQMPQLQQSLRQAGFIVQQLDIVEHDVLKHNPVMMEQGFTERNLGVMQQGGSRNKRGVTSPEVIRPNVNARNQSTLLMGKNQTGQATNQTINRSNLETSLFNVQETKSSIEISSETTDFSLEVENGNHSIDSTSVMNQLPQAALSRHVTGGQHKLPNLPVSQFVPEVSKWIGENSKFTPLREGVAEAKFSLTPDHLGHIEIKIVSQQGQITAQIFTDTSQAKEALDGQLHQLRQVLQQQGLNLQKLEIVQQTPSSMDLTQTNLSFSQGGFHSPQEQRSQSLTRNGLKKPKEDERIEMERETPSTPYRGSVLKSSSNIDFTA
ncbi:flagellar hook-length control protein FliK [Neobacillus sp. MM2021_6]|uniref:flagellar hook-length control protein FliK n=1 Tax=Bacillaceae TaxID=186817 RepID=UPI00140BB187|nr:MULTISPECIES: flagellar hook-length control protein FliK [Bacillaceae]MBO0961807.1 flagellar hook-length control protein FliK [Neobacillus sp. MM2021_6]NHC21092.1 flagellar hook-length control protein FliK [Bacillus sp. MM2020_4]